MGEPFQLGRYSLHAELASGGMATVYLARQSGAVGFGKTVAIKRLHPHLARDPYFVTMFLDEARLAARVVHPNVVPILDVVATERELFLVLEYIRGETLSGLLRVVRKAHSFVPIPITTSIVIGLLTGLHAAHEAKDEQGKPLDIVHRDVSPQNVIVGADGVARVLDFGVAKAATRLQTTREGQLKGKIPYMAPEQLSGEVSARTDVYATGVVLWEALTSRRLFQGETEAQMLHLVMTAEIAPPSTINPSVPPELDRIALKALARPIDERYASAREMAIQLEAALTPASAMKIAEWMEELIGPTLAARKLVVADIESAVSSANAAPSSIPSSPSLPMLPGMADESSPFAVPHSSASTASLVMKTPPAPLRRPLWPFAVAAVAVLGAIGFVVLTRSPSKPPVLTNPPSAAVTQTSAPEALPATATAPPPAPSAIAPSSVATAPRQPTKPTTTRGTPHPPPSNAAPHGTNSDINSLLDTR